MPKMKTKSSVKKRFRVTGSGKVKAKQAFTSHMMMRKSKKQKRNLRGTTLLCMADAKKVLTCWMPYARKKASKSTATKKEA